MPETIEKKSIQEFKDSGLLWWVNMILHTFGWAIAHDLDSDTIYPVRCKFRGFDPKSNDEGYQKVSKYLKENIVEIEKESRE